MLFQFYANVDGTLPPVETFSHAVNDVINAPVTNPVFGAFNYADCNGDMYAVNVSGAGLVFNVLSTISPSNGIVKLSASNRVFFFQSETGTGTGLLSRSDDGTTFVESSYTVDTANQISIFFDNGGLFCADEFGSVYIDVSGNGETFESNAETFPGTVDVRDCIYAGSDSYAGARFFTYENGGTGFTVQTFTYSGGFDTPTACDLPEINNSNGAFWSFYRHLDVFYALRFEPSTDVPIPSGNALYSSVDGAAWILETADIFNGTLYDYVSLLFFDDVIYAMAGGTVAVYTSGNLPVVNGGQSGNQGVTGGGVNGAGGAVGFSRVSAAVNFGQSVESLAYPAGIIANGNDFGIDLGL